MISLAFVERLCSEFPDDDIALNISGKTLSINGFSVAFSGFKEGVLDRFSKFDPVYQEEVVRRAITQISGLLKGSEVKKTVAPEQPKVVAITPVENLPEDTVVTEDVPAPDVPADSVDEGTVEEEVVSAPSPTSEETEAPKKRGRKKSE